MKKIYCLLIILPLFMTIKPPTFSWDWDWDWNWDFDFDFDKFIEEFKSGIPDFFKNLANSIKDFISKAEEEKDKWLKELTEKAEDLYETVKNDIKEKKDNLEQDIKNMVEKVTETAKYLSYKVCNIADLSYEECRSNKKLLLSRLLQTIEYNFGQCSEIVNQISQLSKNPEEGLKYILLLVNSLSENSDAIEQGKSQIIYDILNCLQEKFVDYWPLIVENLGDKKLEITVKKDVTNLLLKSISNLVDIKNFEQIDGYITKINEKTGLVSDEQVKNIHKGIFNILKHFNDFEQNFYNISANIALNLFINPGNLDVQGDAEFQWLNNTDQKGIKIKLFYNYLLREKNAHSVQAVVFDSPLVSVRGKKETEGGTSKTFVGITLYDKDGNEILVSDIELGKYSPIIYFKKKLFNAMETCLYYNENEDKIDNTGIISAIEKFDGEEYIKCIPKHLSSFTIGSYEDSSAFTDEGKKTDHTAVIVIVSIIGVAALSVGGFFLYRYLKRKRFY